MPDNTLYRNFVLSAADAEKMKSKIKTEIKDDSDDDSVIKVKMEANGPVEVRKAGALRLGVERARSHTASSKASSSRASSPARSESEDSSSSASETTEPDQRCGGMISREFAFTVEDISEDCSLLDLINTGLKSMPDDSVRNLLGSRFNRLVLTSADIFIKKANVRDPGQRDNEITIKKGFLQEIAGMVSIGINGQVASDSEVFVEFHEKNLSEEEQEGHLFFVGLASLSCMKIGKNTKGFLKGTILSVGNSQLESSLQIADINKKTKKNSKADSDDTSIKCSSKIAISGSDATEGMQFIFESDISTTDSQGISILSFIKTARKYFQKEIKKLGCSVSFSSWDRVLLTSFSATIMKAKGSVLGQQQDSVGISLKGGKIVDGAGFLRLDLFDKDEDGEGVHQKVHVEVGSIEDPNVVIYRGPLDARLTMLAGRVSAKAVLLPKKKKEKAKART